MICLFATILNLLILRMVRTTNKHAHFWCYPDNGGGDVCKVNFDFVFSLFSSSLLFFKATKEKFVFLFFGKIHWFEKGAVEMQNVCQKRREPNRTKNEFKKMVLKNWTRTKNKIMELNFNILNESNKETELKRTKKLKKTNFLRGKKREAKCKQFYWLKNENLELK